jgi:hypothetical protein
MNYQEKFEDEGFVYELIVEPWANGGENLFLFNEAMDTIVNG